MLSDTPMSEPSSTNPPNDPTSSQGVSPAKIFLSQESNVASMLTPVQDSGLRCIEPLANYNPATSSWRTSQRCFLTEWVLFSDSFPKSGTMRSGKLYPRPPLVRVTRGKGSFWLPTLVASDGFAGRILTAGVLSSAFVTSTGSVRRQRTSKGDSFNLGLTRTLAIRLMLPTVTGNESKGAGYKRFLGSPHFRGAKTSEALRICEGDPIYLNPLFAQKMMGFPEKWTHLAMPSSRRLRRKSDG